MRSIEDRLDAISDAVRLEPARKGKRDFLFLASPTKGSILDGTGVALPVFSACELAGKPVPAREWFAQDLIPANTVTLLSGDGGTGKSLLSLQLCVAAALGRNWIGITAKAGPSLFLTAEDDRDEVHRRLADIVSNEGVDWSELRGLQISSLAGKDALLCEPDRHTGTVSPTPLYDALERQVAETLPALVVLDTLADTFGGDEIKRAQARQYIGMLRGLALKYSTTVLLLMHPSVAGMSAGSGTSGSTAWSNSVRSRLYLEHVKGDQGDEPDPDLRVLRSMKANYGRIGQAISLRWNCGVFTLADQSGGTFDRIAANAKADRIFLEMVEAYLEQDRNVSASPGPGYAPAVFARDAHTRGIPKSALVASMNRLFKQGRIQVETTGAPSRRTKRIILARSK